MAKVDLEKKPSNTENIVKNLVKGQSWGFTSRSTASQEFGKERKNYNELSMIIGYQNITLPQNKM